MKTNFISNLKRYAFLALAVLGAFVGYSQSTQNPSIGGSKTPSTDPFGQILDIGGSQGTPRDTSGGMIVLSSFTKTDCFFTCSNEIGGGGKGTGTTDTGTGQFDDDDFDPFDIGGKSSTGGLGLNVTEIGGRNSGGRGTSTGGELAESLDIGGRGTSSDTGQFDDDTDPYDIGGRGGHTGTGTGEFAILSLEYIPGDGCIFDTGGRNTGTDELNHNPIGGKNSDGGLIIVADTGGRNGTGTSTSGDYGDDNDDDTGGRGSHGTTGEVPESYAYLSAMN